MKRVAARGHSIVAAVRDVERAKRDAPQFRYVRADFVRDDDDALLALRPDRSWKTTARAAAASDRALPPRFRLYSHVWTALGVPAFLALVVVFYLMVAKPAQR